MKIIVTLITVMTTVLLNVSASEIHVSPTGDDSNNGMAETPLKTLHAAQQAVRAVIKSGLPQDGIAVCLHAGTYQISKPLMFGAEDSGALGKPVVWKAAGNAKPVISGGISVSGWTEYKDGIWKTTFESKEKLRQLYINDRPADMAAYGKALIPTGWRGEFEITGKESWAAEAGTAFDGMAFNAADIPEITHPEDLEFQQRRTWTIQRSNVTAIRQPNETEKVIVLARPVAAIGMRMGWHCGFSTKKWKEVYLYNALSFVDQPGEFYFDRAASTLYYKPRSGQDMKTATVIIPVTTQLVRIQGKDRKTHVHDIAFEGITFAHTKWQMMKMGDSYGAITYQSSAMSVKFLKDGMWHGNPASPIYTSTDLPPGVVELNSGERFAFRNCIFRSLGCTALNIENDVDGVEIVGNVFDWVEGSGINVGHPHHTYIGKENDDNHGFGPYNIDNRHDKWNETVEGLVKNVTVANNLFRNTCWTWWQMSPIAHYYGYSIHIEHNDILEAPYNAVTIGWSWGEFNGIPRKNKWHTGLGRQGGKPSLTVHDIKLNHNRIIDSYTKLSDTGAIYFIGDCAMQEKGKVPTLSEVVGNYLTEKKPSRGAAILYTDEGTAYLRFDRNVIDGAIGFHRVLRRGKDSRHKQFTHNFCSTYSGELTPKARQIRDAHTTENDNIYLPRQKNSAPRKLEEWPEEAQKIIANAGLEPEYKDLFNKLLK